MAGGRERGERSLPLLNPRLRIRQVSRRLPPTLHPLPVLHRQRPHLLCPDLRRTSKASERGLGTGYGLGDRPSQRIQHLKSG